MALLAVAWPGHAQQEEEQERRFSITPRLEQTVTATDNARLAPRGQERRDIIYNVAPGVLVTAEGKRIRGRADYLFNNRFHASDSDRDTATQRYNVRGNAELLRNFLFLDASATRREQSETFLDPVGVGEGVFDDTTTVTTWRVSPYATQRLGRLADVTARYAYDRVRSRRDSTAETYTVDVTSVPMGRRYFWSGNFEWQEIRFDDDEVGTLGDDPVILATISGTAGVELTRRLSVFGTVGEERNDFVSPTGDIDGSFWNAGFRWNPNVRTSLEGTVGERFFGRTGSLDLRHQRRRAMWQASFVQLVSTTRSQLLLADENCLDFFIDQGFTEEEALVFCFELASPVRAEDIFVLERAQVSVRYNLRRSEWSLLAFRTDRDFLSERAEADDFQRDDRRTGVLGRVVWSLGPATTWENSISRTWVQPDGADGEDREQRFWSFRTGLTRQLALNMRGSLS
ncbi:TIGR03016 family PEP-CTERM system-associated outer membrane protein, partial [Aquisalimonas sp.]|uniref:TIGR03016 family PEP-CTERM system-associated outer membrane protein n=1 Tax=Aquisalimonas sp. TaxID=1872621 RepID=UPI0025C0801B